MKESKAIKPVKKSLSKRKEKLIEKGLAYFDKKRVILMIDDELLAYSIHNYFKKHLKDKKCPELIHAYGAEEALKIIEDRNGNIDLIHFDKFHVGMDRTLFINKVKSKYPKLKFLICEVFGFTWENNQWITDADYDGEKSKVQKLIKDRLVEDFFEKPFQIEDYLAKINSLLQNEF